MKVLLPTLLWLLLVATSAPAQSEGGGASPSGGGELIPQGAIPEKQEAGAKSPVQSFPGVAEVVPRLSTLTEEAGRIRAEVASLGDISGVEVQVGQAREQQAQLNQRLAEMGDPAGWNVNRLLNSRMMLVRQQESLDEILKDLSEPLAALDQIRQEWEGKKAFWARWQASFSSEQLQLSGEPFAKAQSLVADVLSEVGQAMEPLVAQQKQVSALREKNQSELTRIDRLLGELRKQIFKKTALPFYSSDYYRQFSEELWLTVKSGASEVRWLRTEFLAEQSWVLLLQVAVGIALPLTIRRHRRQAEKSEEWQFIFDHPWATGIFVAVSALSFLYSHPPALMGVLFWVLAAFSAAVLISGVLRNPRKVFTVYLLASLFIVSLVLNTIALPLPLYRLYIMLLALAGAPLLWLMARSNIRAHDGKRGGFSLSLQAGALVLLATCVAQFWGYSRLAMRIVESSIETVFLGLFVLMIVRIGSGGIDFLLQLPFLRLYTFFRRYGSDLAEKLKGAFRFFSGAYAFFYLFTVWGVFDSVPQAWDGLLRLGFSVGETQVTLEMVVFAGIVLYLAISLSWVLQALLETEVMSRRRLDRGVRDAIKKLLHYAVVLVGFAFAMNLAGFALENFVVLAGAFGIGIGFGLQNIVNNFVSGIILLFERPVKVGDMLVLDNEWGSVRKIGLRSTVVETLDQAEIIVPNSMLVSEKVINWSLTTPMARITVPVGVAYGSEVEKVLRILNEVCREHGGVLGDPEPSPIFVGFGDSSLDFELRAWISDVGARLRIRSELGMAVDRRFREEGVTIPFPQRDLHFSSIEGRFFDSAQKLKGALGDASPQGSGKELGASPGRR